MIPSARVTVGPSPLKILGKLLIASVAITVGVTLVVVIVGFLAEPWLLAWSGIIIRGSGVIMVCYCLFATLAASILERPRVEIGLDGFVTQGTAGRRVRRWSDIEGDFTVIRAGLQTMVAYHLTGAFKDSGWKRPANSPPGSDEVISFCGELSISATELVEVLNQWKQDLHDTT
jgi:hypothetical protein